jgi:hypothetical protein
MAIPWSTTPPPAPQQRPLSLIRVAPGRALSAIITVERAIYLDTHFWHGRTSPCTGLDCEPCSEGCARRSHCYVAVFTAGDHKHLLLELTQTAADPLAEYCTTFGSLRGCWINARRAKPQPNSRIEMTCRPADLAKIQLPREPDLLTALTTIWRLPANAFSTITDEPGTQALQVDLERLRAATHSTRKNGHPHEDRRAQIP